MLLKNKIEQCLKNVSVDWLDNEYTEETSKKADEKVTLESVRMSLAKVKGSMSDVIISSREDRF